MLGVTLRYPYEIRKEAEYFDDIPDEKVPKEMLELPSHIVETKSAHFEPDKFQDHYENALKELLRKKQAGKKVERVSGREAPKVINLMDALHGSVKSEKQSAARPKPNRRRIAKRRCCFRYQGRDRPNRRQRRRYARAPVRAG
jgi:DNA end-binding protein Ku